MMLKPERLGKLLSKSGFELEWMDRGEMSCVFTRPGYHPELFESIHATSSGKLGEYICAYVGSSVVRYRIAWAGLMESELLTEIASDQSRGWSRVSTDDETAAWEYKLAKICSERTQEFGKKAGPQLLTQTDEVRSAVPKYLSRIPSPFNQAEPLLTQDAPAELLEEADRLMTFHSLIGFADRALVRVVVLALLRLGPEIEGRSFVRLSGNPTDDRDLMWRIRIMTDRILTKHPELKRRVW